MLIGLVIVGCIAPVLAETGSISILADPKDFVIKEYIQQDINGQIIEPKDSIPITVGYSELLHITPVFFNNKISYTSDDVSKLSNLLLVQTLVMARYTDASGKWVGMEYTAPSGTYTLSVDTNGIIAALVNALKEEDAKIEAQNATIAKQELRIAALEKKVGI